MLDASGDKRVAALLDEYADIIVYRRSGPDRGQASAIHEGWSCLPGDVLGWLNADDFLYPGALKAAADAFQASDVDVVTGDSVFLDGAGRFLGHHPGVGPPDDQILTSNPISQPSTFVRRIAVEAVGGINQSLHYTMDWDLWVRLFRNGARFTKNDAVLSGVMIDRGTKTMGFGPRRRAEVLRIIAPHVDHLRKTKVLYGMALQYADDRTGLVSRALDLGGLRQGSGSAQGKVIAKRRFRAPASLALTHYDLRESVYATIVCEGLPRKVEWSVTSGPSLAWDWPSRDLMANFPVRLKTAGHGILKIFPSAHSTTRVTRVVLKD